MMKKGLNAWRSFPPDHKKRFYQALAGYILLSLLAVAWTGSHADTAVKGWEIRIPYAITDIKDAMPAAALPEEEAVEAATFATPPDFSNAVAVHGMPEISIIVANMGLADAITESAIADLPQETALSFSPYSKKLQEYLAKAQSVGKETMVLVPMEPDTYPHDDPGPKALLSSLSEEENTERLKSILARSPGVVGVMNFMGGQFLSDMANLQSVFAEMKKTGVIFVENPVSAISQANTVASEASLPYVAVDVIIDANATDTAIRDALADIETTARDRGYAVGLANPYPLTFDILQSWAKTLSVRGFRLAPITTRMKAATSSHEQEGILQTGQAPATAAPQDQH